MYKYYKVIITLKTHKMMLHQLSLNEVNYLINSYRHRKYMNPVSATVYGIEKNEEVYLYHVKFC